MNTAWITKSDNSVIQVNEGGTLIIGKVSFTINENELMIRNGGNPDKFGPAKWSTEPFYFKKIEVEIPGKVVMYSLYNGAVNLGNDKWQLAGDGEFVHHHHKHADPAYPWYADSTRYHMIDGGDTFYCRFTDPHDIYEFTSVPTAQQKALALQILQLNDNLIEKYPLLRRTLDFYSLDASSLNRLTTIRNFGWFMIPSNYVSRWTGTNIDYISHWYGFTDMWAPGDNQCNCHYSHDAWWLVNYLKTGNPFSMAIGLNFVRFKVAYGLFDVDLPYTTCTIKGQWRGEKSGESRRGAGVGPFASKEWDLGLIIASILFPEDNMIKRGIAVRKDRLLNIPDSLTWNGAGGGRQAGAYLRNLLDFYNLTGDIAFKNKATSFITHVWNKFYQAKNIWDPQHPGNPMLWFPNSSRVDFNACWEEVILHRMIAAWMDLGVGNDKEQILKDMVEWAINNGTAWRDLAKTIYQVAYEVGVQSVGPTANLSYKNFSTPTNGLWWIPFAPRIKTWWPGVYDAQLDALERTTLTRIGQGWSDIDQNRPPLNPSQFSVDNPGEGPGGFKTRGFTMLCLRE